MPPRKDIELAMEVADAIRERAAELGLSSDRATAEWLDEKDPTIFERAKNPVRTLESWVRQSNPALPRRQTRWKIAKAMDIPPERLGLESHDRDERLFREFREWLASDQRS